MKVNVNWGLKIDGNGYNPNPQANDYRPPWLNMEVEREVTMGDGKRFYFLKGNTCCPVRIERCTIFEE